MKTLYISDLDGTLLNQEGKISPYTAQVINGLVEQGIAFTYATARSFASASAVTKPLRLKLPVVVFNGVMLMDQAGNQLEGKAFTAEENRLIQEVLGQYNFPVLVHAFLEGRERVSWLQGNETGWLAGYLEKRKGDKRLRPVNTWEELMEGQPFYYDLIGEKGTLQPAAELLAAFPFCGMVFQQERNWTEYLCEIMPKGATKAEGAKRIKQMYQLDRMVAFGDALNDLPLFEAADEAYAVADAAEALKAAADGLIRPCGQDGVADWLSRHILS